MHTILTIAGAIVIFLFCRGECYERKEKQTVKVYSQSNGYNYKDVPTIVLKDKWLEVAGFDIGSDLLVECGNGKLTISAVDRSWSLVDSSK